MQTEEKLTLSKMIDIEPGDTLKRYDGEFYIFMDIEKTPEKDYVLLKSVKDITPTRWTYNEVFAYFKYFIKGIARPKIYSD